MKQKILTMLSVSLSLWVTKADAQEKILVDNDKMKVTEYISEPGKDVCGPGKHSHKEHLTILLTDAKVKMVREDGTLTTEAYAADRHQYTITQNGKSEQIPTDGTFWMNGSTHTVTNQGQQPIKLIIVEMKQ